MTVAGRLRWPAFDYAHFCHIVLIAARNIALIRSWSGQISTMTPGSVNRFFSTG